MIQKVSSKMKINQGLKKKTFLLYNDVYGYVYIFVYKTNKCKPDRVKT